MKISLVTPVLNDHRVVNALDSILVQQHGHELELIVIDGGSTDGTLARLEAYREQISILLSEPDAGIYDAMNKGIRLATGAIVGILNADDQYADPFVLRDVARCFNDVNISACYGDLICHNRAGKVTRYWKSGPQHKLKWHVGWAPPHPTFFVRKSVYETYGAFDASLSVSADYELMLRLLYKHQLNVKYLQRALVNMAAGGHASGSVSNIIRGNLQVLRAWRNNQLTGGLLAPAFKLSRKLCQLVVRPESRPS